MHGTIRAVACVAIATALAACAAVTTLRQAPSVSVAPGFAPRLSAAVDATRITVGYLDAQRSELAAPELHQDPVITSVTAVRADDAPAIDGCIPPGKGAGVVWITRGSGDYLNLANHPWSPSTGHATGIVEKPNEGVPGNCMMPGPAGVIVIDDATGDILGVYPLPGPDYPHPTAAPSG